MLLMGVESMPRKRLLLIILVMANCSLSSCYMPRSFSMRMMFFSRSLSCWSSQLGDISMDCLLRLAALLFKIWCNLYLNNF